MKRIDVAALSARRWLALSGSTLVLVVCASLAGPAAADDPVAPAAAPQTGAGAEGSEVAGVVVTAEHGSAAATGAPTKASLNEMEPESIINHSFVEQVAPETANWVEVLNIAPSISAPTVEGGGVGDYENYTLTLRGFQDGEFNITYDGLAFGDTNNPTHHSADYFPTSTIGAVVIDRGPGAAGDLGQANFGGAIHFFSPTVADTFGASQKVTYGSFNTWADVTTINTGQVSQLGGAKLLLNFDNRWSNGEITDSNGHQYNQLAKLVVPMGDNWQLTVFGNLEYSAFNFEDSSGPGETWEQVLQFGKDFGMNKDPHSEHYVGFNYEVKRTDFDYVDLKGQIDPSFEVEDQAYTYHYSNKTKSANDLTGVFGPDQNWFAPGGPNTSPPTASGSNPNDIGGYDKLNEYRVLGDVLRFTKDWTLGTLKFGGLVEGSRTFRHNCFVDETTGFTPDRSLNGGTNNCKTLEESSWLQEQVFVDFYWRPVEGLTIAPGYKYVNFTRNIDATFEKINITATKTAKAQPLHGTNTYSSPVYFLTTNYKIRPDLAVYAQVATSFLVPELSDLYVNGINLNTVKPQFTTNYQAGVVYTHGNVTADADIYDVEATNLQVACNVPDPSMGPNAMAAEFCNTGKARFDGVEGEAAYAFDVGLTLFANASYNEAKQLVGPGAGEYGAAPAAGDRLPNAPLWTAAAGGLYTKGPWRGSLTYKQTGDFVVYGANQIKLPGFYSLDASASYDFGHFAVKLQAFNLTGVRAIVNDVPASGATALFQNDTSIYTFQAGRTVEVTLVGKY